MTIYLDSAATTQCSAGAIEAAVGAMRENYYNPSALYHEGLMLKEQLNGVRSMILGALRAEGSVVFTGGGTESDNLALFGCKKPKQGDIVVSAGEHAAVYAAATELKQRGYDVRFCPVNRDGSTDFEAFCQMITEKTALASVMHVNNETGAINDIESSNSIFSGTVLTCMRSAPTKFTLRRASAHCLSAKGFTCHPSCTEAGRKADCVRRPKTFRAFLHSVRRLQKQSKSRGKRLKTSLFFAKK